MAPTEHCGPEVDSLPWALRTSMEKMLHWQGGEAHDSEMGQEYLGPAQRLRAALEEVLDVSQLSELDALLGNPFVKPSENLRAALDKAVGSKNVDCWQLLFTELGKAVCESNALIHTIEMVRSLLSSQSTSDETGTCTPRTSGTCTPMLLEPDSEPLSLSHTSPSRRSSTSSATGAASKRLSRSTVRRSRARLAHAPCGAPSRRTSQSLTESIGEACGAMAAKLQAAVAPDVLPLEHLRGSPKHTEPRLAVWDAATPSSSSTGMEKQPHERADQCNIEWETLPAVKSECVKHSPGWEQQTMGQFLGESPADLQNCIDVRNMNSPGDSHDDSTQSFQEVKEQLSRLGREFAENRELTDRLRKEAEAQREQKEQAELLQAYLARVAEEEAAEARRKEEERAYQAERELEAANRNAKACFRNSIQCLLKPVDMRNNEEVLEAKEQLREIVEDARESGLPEADLADGIAWELRLARQTVKNVVDECREADMNSIGALRDLKQQLTHTISNALQDGVSEMDLADAETWRRKVHNRIEDIKGNIRVFCRVRPLSSKEMREGDTAIVSQVDSMTLEVERGMVRPIRSRTPTPRGTPRGTPRASMDPADDAAPLFDSSQPEVSVFRFDSAFGAGETQQDVFADCRELIQSAFDGFNVTIFAYGQTGAGKTYTMTGTPSEPGLAPQVIEEIFRVAGQGMRRFEHRVTTSMVELYRNELIDLLQVSRFDPDTKKVSMRTDSHGAVFFENVLEEECPDQDALAEAVERGTMFRKTCATAMNSESSRSHLIQTIKIYKVNRETGHSTVGKILLVDLAGSERLKKSLATGEVQKDSIEINRSLTALGDVIEALTQGHPSIPYRNHKLTQILQDALGRTAKTLMFVHCSPAKSNLDETLATLKYATRAKKIKRSATAQGS